MPIAVIAAINVIRASPALAIMNGAALQTGFTWFQESAITHTHTYMQLYSCQSESDQPIGLWVPKHEARLNNPRALREIKTRLTMTNLLARPNDDDEPQQIPRP